MIEWCTAHLPGACPSEVEDRARAKLVIEHAVFAASSNGSFLTVRNVVVLGRRALIQNKGLMNPGFQMKVYALFIFPSPAVNWLHYNNLPTIIYPAQITRSSMPQMMPRVLGMFYMFLKSLSFNILSKNRHLFSGISLSLILRKCKPKTGATLGFCGASCTSLGSRLADTFLLITL